MTDRSFPSRAGSAGAVALAAMLAAAPASAQTETLTYTIAPTVLADPGTYPATQTIGNFGNAALGQYDTILSATISGNFGVDVFTPDTAPGVYSVAGITVFTCNDGDVCWGSDTQTAWSYNFTASDLQALYAGDSAFTVAQSDIGAVATDTTTLTIDVFVPEPASIALFGVSLLGAGLILRRSRA